MAILVLQTIVELFLGLRLPTYFPSARLPLTDTLPLDEDSDGAESDADEPFIYATIAQVQMLTTIQRRKDSLLC